MRRPIITILALLLASQACAAEVKGRASVVDGDTLWVSGVKIRLNGIDAPERGQARFREAAQVLQRLVASQTVTCRLNGDRSHDRFIGIFYVGEVDLAAAVIASGNALDCARYSGGRYRRFETQEARRRIRQASYC